MTKKPKRRSGPVVPIAAIRKAQEQAQARKISPASPRAVPRVHVKRRV